MAVGQISVVDAKALLDQGSVQVIDIRDAQSFSAGHIEGAENIHDQNVDSFMAQADLEKPLLICCYAGMKSQSAAHYFDEQGFATVYSLEGGYNAWQASS